MRTKQDVDIIFQLKAVSIALGTLRHQVDDLVQTLKENGKV